MLVPSSSSLLIFGKMVHSSCKYETKPRTEVMSKSRKRSSSLESASMASGGIESRLFWFFNKDIVFCKTFFQKLCDICGKRNHEKYAQNIKKCMKKCEFGSIRRIHLEKFDENIQKLYEQWQKRERNNSGSHIEQNMC